MALILPKKLSHKVKPACKAKILQIFLPKLISCLLAAKTIRECYSLTKLLGLCGCTRDVHTDDEAFKSICRILGPLTKKPTLGVQHAVEAGYLFKEHASISAWLFTFLSYCEVTKPLSRIKTITRMRRIYKRRLVIAGFIISGTDPYISYPYISYCVYPLKSVPGTDNEARDD